MWGFQEMLKYFFKKRDYIFRVGKESPQVLSQEAGNAQYSERAVISLFLIGKLHITYKKFIKK